MTTTNEKITQLMVSVQTSLHEHKKWGTMDAYFYNGGTGVVLLCTTLATYLPDSQTSVAHWLPQVLTGMATFWVALDRALTFGPRWRFHLSQKSGYRRVLDKLTLCDALSGTERENCLRQAIELLDGVRSQEPDMPGVGVSGAKN